MSNQKLLQRISCDPKIMVGKPVIKGTRLTVEFINRYEDRLSDAFVVATETHVRFGDK